MAGFGFPFFLQVTHITHIDDPKEASHLPGGRWHPPLRRSCFTIQHTTGWYIWDPGRSPNSNDPKLRPLRRPSSAEESRLEMYRSATMFWEPYTYNYLHIPIDCTLTDVKASPVFWKHPGFGISKADGRDDIAIIGHLEEHQQLHVPGPQSWFEKLLPITFQPPKVHQPPTDQNFCTLAGDLDILIALIAFSTTPPNVLRAIDRLFRPDPTTTRFNPDSGLPSDDRKFPLYHLRDLGPY
jgi:hypothetical protein